MFDETQNSPAASGPAPIRCALMAPVSVNDAEPETEDLVRLIVTRYHDTHRREFPEAIRLARKVEATHAGEPDCPRGLADHLALMADDLESHQQREEQVLFPMILAGGGPMVRFPINRMMAEHLDVDDQLLRLRALTKDFSSPPGTSGVWQALMAACRKLDEDLREHMRLENEVLFAPFLD